MNAVTNIRERLPEAAKDIRLNLQSVLEQNSLSREQAWGVAAACAIASRNLPLRDAILSDASDAVDAEVLEDAKAAASIMGMNNVFYRFKHMIGKEIYSTMPARLRMNRIARPLASRTDFELFCLAVSAISGCESCIRSHEHVVINAGLREEQVFDAVRIASTIYAAAVSLEMN